MRFRFRKTILASTLTAVVGVATWLALPADAATTPVLQFTYIVYDSPGKDTRTNASLNAEYVRITNTTAKAINIGRATLKDAAGHTYTFPNYSLAAHAQVWLQRHQL
jgi:hypothetical protein